MVQSILADKKKLPAVSFEQFVKIHRSQLALIPKLYWAALYEKITSNVLDLNKNIEIDTKKITYAKQVTKQVTARVCNKNGIRQDDPRSVFLVPHCAHYYANEGRELIKELIATRSPLLAHLRKLMNIKETGVGAFINSLLDELWKVVIPFTIKTKGNKKSLPIWSIIDPIGMAIQHSSSPNFQMVTFTYLNLRRIYSVIFPIVAVVNFNEEVTRDYHYFEKFDHEQIKLNAHRQNEHLVGLQNLKSPSPSNSLNAGRPVDDESAAQWTVEDETELLKQTLLIPWRPDNLRTYYLEQDINFQQDEPSVIEFFERRGFAEPYSMIRCEPQSLKSAVAAKSLVKVYCDDKQVMSYLTDPRFVFVNHKELADIWWFKGHFFDFALLYSKHPTILVNQFPLGHLLSDKSVMPALCRRKLNCFDGNINPHTLESYPQFLPATFDLTTELVKFVKYFTSRQQRNLANYWIIKPTNLNESADCFITDNLNAIIRIRSSQSRVASLYVANPLLFYRPDIGDLVKFELRYFVVLTSVLPLKLFVFKGFQVDFANRPYEMTKTNLYNHQMHFTDMSRFSSDVQRLGMDHQEFIQRFNYQYQFAKFDFEQADAQAMAAIRELFELCAEKFPFSAINQNSGSAALYQIDVLLGWEEQLQFGSLVPVRANIIDCNLNPNCEFICQRFPNFYDDCFSLMFLDNEQNCNFRAI